MSSQVNLPSDSNSFVLISSLKTLGNGDGFADAVTVWINKPHVVKRNLCGSKLLFYRTVNKEGFYKNIATQNLTTDLSNVGKLLSGYLLVDEDCDECVAEEKSINNGDVIEVESLSGVADSQIAIIIRDLLPKNREKASKTREFIIYDNVLRKLTIIPYTEDKLDSEDALLPKLVSWSRESHLKTSVTSLKLVPIDEYNVLYNHLKEKYGKKFVELLWKQERKDKAIENKQSFGCGNGLLVHILSSEGEETITPSADNTYPDYDWLVGNHSDELTPWIPVMAARSSYQCRYFVLPCCHFDFDKKFNQKQPGVSNYRSYLNFVQEVGHICGFNVEEDTLRIPSTKRVCFVGKSRTYSAEDETRVDIERTTYIQNRCNGSNIKTW
ncbi:hypothetical protein KUTeg_009776 [Tegillarca granosa]|uniref:tRNA (uracil-O(2)-)-methyltransferase n=1 Tax=Tegillarca granosa TaxID=220873 RepID=A0ABQ9F9W1_TEGGR|nr:hypothetical protein KUTeg_009776 [Tegillarca granosa]